jgi:hypothetical protein
MFGNVPQMCCAWLTKVLEIMAFIGWNLVQFFYAHCLGLLSIQGIVWVWTKFRCCPNHYSRHTTISCRDYWEQRASPIIPKRQLGKSTKLHEAVNWSETSRF